MADMGGRVFDRTIYAFIGNIKWYFAVTDRIHGHSVKALGPRFGSAYGLLVSSYE